MEMVNPVTDMADCFNIEQLIRENIRMLEPYASARDEFSGSASVFLDANESPYNRYAMSGGLEDGKTGPLLNRYPDPGQRALKKDVARLKGLDESFVFLGNGSDEGIDLLFRVLCEPGRDNVVTVDPTYGMYRVCARINNVEQRSVLLRPDFSLDPSRVLEAVDENTRMVFLCSPNNPTANAMDESAVDLLLKALNCFLVIDEAYIDFSSSPGFLSRLKEEPKLIILQTLSKAWGLAGIRLGMVFAHPVLNTYLRAVKYPYNLNSLSMDVARQALKQRHSHRKRVEQILAGRARLSDRLKAFSFVEMVYPSDANFLLVKVSDPIRLYRDLMAAGIIVRDRSTVPLCDGCIRISVGTEEEHETLLQEMKRLEKTYSAGSGL